MTINIGVSGRRAKVSAEAILGPLPRKNVSVLTDKVFPILRMLIGTGYFALDVEGAQNVPRSGPTIYVGNHAGWFTLDTLFGALALADHVGVDRLPWGAVHDRVFKTPIGRFFEAIGGFPASWMRTPQALPREMEVFSIYPEGTEGNCKSFLYAYQMRRWRTGFVRLASALDAQIVPVAIIGGEECLPAISQVAFTKPLMGTVMALPLSMVPLPSRWKFVFMPPVKLEDFGLTSGAVIDQTGADYFAEQLRARVQRTLDHETGHRMLVRASRLIRRSVPSL